MTWNNLHGQCQCGHSISVDHSAEIRMEERQDVIATMIIVKGGPVRAVKLFRFMKFDVRLVCDICRCRNITRAEVSDAGLDTGLEPDVDEETE